MAEMTDMTSYSAKLKESIEFTTKVVAAMTGLFYALGLFATNLYLTGFRFTDFSVVRPKSILTGAWVFAVLWMSSSPVFVAWYKCRNITPKNNIRRILAYVRAYLLACLVPWILLALLLSVAATSYNQFRDIEWRSFAANRWDGDLLGALVFIIVGLILGLAIKSTVHASESKVLGPGLIIRASFILISTLFLTAWFDYLILPGLSASLGGETIEKVTLLIDKSHRDAIKELGISLPFQACPDLTEPVGLVYETEHNLLVVKSGLRPTILDRSLVSGIVHDSSFYCHETNVEKHQ